MKHLNIINKIKWAMIYVTTQFSNYEDTALTHYFPVLASFSCCKMYYFHLLLNIYCTHCFQTSVKAEEAMVICPHDRPEKPRKLWYIYIKACSDHFAVYTEDMQAQILKLQLCFHMCTHHSIITEEGFKLIVWTLSSWKNNSLSPFFFILLFF